MNNNLNNIRNIQMPSIRSVGNKPSQTKENTKGKAFADVLKQQAGGSEGLKFSKHANSRLETRNIKLDKAQLGRLDESLEIAKAKGIKDSLVIMDDLSFVVNVKTSTVVTALKGEEANRKVFTNIDGAVII